MFQTPNNRSRILSVNANLNTIWESVFSKHDAKVLLIRVEKQALDLGERRWRQNLRFISVHCKITIWLVSYMSFMWYNIITTYIFKESFKHKMQKVDILFLIQPDLHDHSSDCKKWWFFLLHLYFIYQNIKAHFEGLCKKMS